MKSEYYLATVINAYRRAMDGEDVYSLASELDDVAHREYTAAYAFGDNAQTVGYENSQTKGKCTYIANVLGSEEGFVLAEMRNRFRKGDVLEVLSPGENFRKSFRASAFWTRREPRRRTPGWCRASTASPARIPCPKGIFCAAGRLTGHLGRKNFPFRKNMPFPRLTIPPKKAIIFV